MTAITVFNGSFCGADAVAKKILDITGYQLVTDQDIISDAARMSGVDEQAIARVLYNKGAVHGEGRFNQRQIISWLRFATAKRLAKGENCLFWGYTALLLPPQLNNILRVCVISGMEYRLKVAEKEGYAREEAREQILTDDTACGNWAVAVTDRNDPWATTLYDLILPVGSIGSKQSAYLVVEQLTNAAVQDVESPKRKVDDFLLATKVETELARKGFNITASAEKECLTLCFDNHEDTLKSATRNLLEFVSGFDGVTDVELGVGRKYNENDIHERGMRQGLAITRLAEIPQKSVDDDFYYEPPEVQDEDSELAATIQGVLLQKGLDISVFARNGFVSLAINNHKLLLECVSKNLCNFVGAFDGVRNVEIGIGREYHQVAKITKIRLNLSREFVVDDDREFDLYLSPRLCLGALRGSFAMHDGKAAFYSIHDDEPEVIMLDMPGPDDTDALQRLKRDHPKTEVLVLSGHESEKDRETCLNMGAFAFFRKPVNMASLSDTIRAAREKNRLCPCS